MANNQIALLAQAPEFDTPFESQGKALQIKNLMNQGAVQDMDMAQRRQAIADDAGMRGVYSSVDDPAERIKALYRINPKAAQAVEKAQVDMGKDRAATAETTAKTQTENLKAINMRMQQARDLLGNVGDKQSAATWVQGLYSDPDIGKFLTQHVGTVEQALARIPDPQTDPQGFNKWRMASQLSAEKLVETTMPKVGARNLGNRSQTTMTDPITGKVTVTDSQAIGQSPDSVASTRQAAARLAFDKDQATSNQDALMDPLAIRMTAQQYLAGDTGALANFGRGAQGATNLNAVRLEIAKQANALGLNGSDIAARVAEFGGLKAGQRTAGTRSASIEIAANEVAQLAPLALSASDKVVRSGFLPFGKVQVMFDSNTNDPNLRQFAMANTALVNAYGQAMARGGAATVSDKDHARELLSTTFDQPSYAAAVAQLQRETKAAQAAPKQVRKDLSEQVSSRDGVDKSGAKPSLEDIFK